MFNRRKSCMKPCMMPPVQHPVVQNTNYKYHEYIVPEIHPTHTTTVNEHMYKHYHTFPHTNSEVEEIYHQHFMPSNMANTANMPCNRPRRRRPYCF